MSIHIEEIVQNTLRRVFNDKAIVYDKSRFAGGLTNFNYIMTIHGKDYVVRQPGTMTEEMIDRKIEQVNNSIASELGVNSNCIYFDDKTGIKISEYIVNSENVALADPSKESHIQKISQLIKQIHGSAKQFPNHFDWLQELTKYEGIVRQLNGDFYHDYHDLKQKLLSFMDAHLLQVNYLPCHNDTVPENFILDQHGRMYLVDWEYAGMNDPHWDIAAYILESRLPDPSANLLISYYYEQPLTARQKQSICLYMVAQDLLWATWALIKHYSGDDFLDYYRLRYERFRRNVHNLSACASTSWEQMVRF